MDRQIVYSGAIPLDTDQLQQNKNAMIALGYALQAILGSSTQFDGLACTATTPASLSVNLAPGSVYSVQNVDNSAYGSVGADTTDQIVKQGIVSGVSAFALTAPVTSGFSVVYLIQGQYQDVDSGSAVLPYYNASNPAVAYNGPGNSGTSQNTVRKGVCLLQAKAGTAAPTGSQATPAPDAGFTGLYAITVANGQTTITSSSIAQLTTAPFINPKLPALAAYLQTGAATYAVDSSGAANFITASLNPGISSLTPGMTFRVKVANTSTGPVVMNLNGIGNTPVFDSRGLQAGANAVLANGIYAFSYDGTNIVMLSPGSGNSSVGSGFRNLKIVTTSNTTSTISADTVTLQNANGYTAVVQNVSQAYSTASSGVSGLDTGSLAANTWYNEFLIFNPSSGAVRTLLSLSATAPTLPNGYTFFARVGAIRTDASVRLLWKIQYGRDVQYVVGTNPAAVPVIANGSAGSVTAPTYVPVSVTGVVPPTAQKIKVGLEVSGGATDHAIAAPNANYGNITSANIFLAQTNGTVSGSGSGSVAEMLLESTNIYYAADAAATSLQCLGWTDNI